MNWTEHNKVKKIKHDVFLQRDELNALAVEAKIEKAAELKLWYEVEKFSDYIVKRYCQPGMSANNNGVLDKDDFYQVAYIGFVDAVRVFNPFERDFLFAGGYTVKELKDMTVPEMRVYAAENNIPLDNLKLKPDIKNRIETVLKERAGEPAAPGEQPPTGTPPVVPPTASTGAPDAPPPDIKGMTIDRVLKCMKPLMKGDDVKAVQAVLIALKFHCGVEGANGVYNASTAFAVRMFQSHNRLIVSGKVDKFTAQALGATWEEPKK